MEPGDPTVSIDLLVKSLLALGVSKKELGRTISWHPNGGSSAKQPSVQLLIEFQETAAMRR